MRPRHCDSLTVVVVGSLKFRHLYGLLFTCISVHPSIWLLFSSSFFQILPTTQLIREITEAKTQKWTLPPKDMSLKIERVSRAKFETNFCSKKPPSSQNPRCRCCCCESKDNHLTPIHLHHHRRSSYPSPLHSTQLIHYPTVLNAALLVKCDKVAPSLGTLQGILDFVTTLGQRPNSHKI